MTGSILTKSNGTTVYKIDGKEVDRETFDRAFPPLAIRTGTPYAPAGRSTTGVKPKLSDALAVHPTQVAEATEHAKRQGVPTEFTPDGRPIIRSRAHQKAYLKRYGFFNKSGGYGD